SAFHARVLLEPAFLAAHRRTHCRGSHLALLIVTGIPRAFSATVPSAPRSACERGHSALAPSLQQPARMRWSCLLPDCAAACCVALLTRVVRAAALRRRWIDRNEGRTQIPYRPTPRVGGIAITTGFMATLAAVNLLVTHGEGALGNPLIWLASAMVFSVGLLD